MTASPAGSCFAVVVNWNGGEANLPCLASLLAAGFSQERVVFVDNGSRDGSLELVLASYPALVVLPLCSNLGFGEGANRGAARALALGAEAVYFVNNDVSLPEGSLQPLLARLLADPRNGIVGPRVLYADAPARIWCAGGALTWRENLSTLRGQGEPDGPAWQAECEVDYVAGCALLARAELLRAIGLFDVTFFAYMEDVDLCLRAKARGWRVVSIGSQHCWHAPSSATGGGYSPRRKYMQGVNSIHFLRRWAGSREWLRFLCFDVATLPLLFVVGLARGRARGVLAKALGIWHGTLGRRVEAGRLERGGTPLW
jgi:GT2 family glycosyltransferase